MLNDNKVNNSLRKKHGLETVDDAETVARK
jgi:hypothetical protein